MRWLDLTLSTPEENLALDEALLLEAEAGRGSEVLRVWEWPQPAVVLGSGCRLTEDVEETACHADGVPILRRSSGGGTVLLGAGCLCYSLVLAYERLSALREIPSSYVYILDRICDALTSVAPSIERAGTSDLAVQGRKVSGSAQQRKRTHLLHHGTLLYGFDGKLVRRYLTLPSRQPGYRGRREHEEFLTNLSGTASQLTQLLRVGWKADDLLEHWPGVAAHQLVREKYGTPEWTARR